MTKKKSFIKLLLVLFIITFISCQSYSQSLSNNYLLLNFGIAMPTAPNDFSDNWSSGFTFGLGLEFLKADISSGLIEFNYNYYPLNVSDQPLEEVTGGDINTYSVSLNFKVTPFAIKDKFTTMKPYLRLGIGYFHKDIEQIEYFSNLTTYSGDVIAINEEAENGIMGVGSFGLEFSISDRFNAHIESRYDYYLSSENKLRSIPIKFGFNIGI